MTRETLHIVVLLSFVAWVSACDEMGDNVGFVDFASDAGLEFVHFNGAEGNYYLPEIMGTGAALLDYDNDGDLDIYLVQGARLPIAVDSSMRSLPQTHPGSDRLFQNQLTETGALGFVDVSQVSGITRQAYGMGVAVADYDGDGWSDIYVTNYGENILYQNNGDGSFDDISEIAQVAHAGWSTSASFLDYDNDGDLDLYVTNYVEFSEAENVYCDDASIQRDYCAPQEYAASADVLYRNEGNRKFSDVSGQSGIADKSYPGLGVTVSDLDQDGWDDIYVANDRTENLLWHNNGDGSFDDIALMTGVALNADGRAEASMGVTAGDFDNDGDTDLFMTHFDPETNTLYRNEGKGRFSDVSSMYGLGFQSLGLTGWGTRWADFDNNGLPDLFVSNGAVTIQPDQVGDPFPYSQRDQLFMQSLDHSFREISGFMHPKMPEPSVGRGAAFGDIDNDGDIDVLVSNNYGTAQLLINQQRSGHHWLIVDLRFSGANRNALGARVSLKIPGRSIQTRVVRTDGSYLSASDRRVHFGLGEYSGDVELSISWPDGVSKSRKLRSVDAIHVIEND